MRAPLPYLGNGWTVCTEIWYVIRDQLARQLTLIPLVHRLKGILLVPYYSTDQITIQWAGTMTAAIVMGLPETASTIPIFHAELPKIRAPRQAGKDTKENFEASSLLRRKNTA